MAILDENENENECNNEKRIPQDYDVELINDNDENSNFDETIRQKLTEKSIKSAKTSISICIFTLILTGLYFVSFLSSSIFSAPCYSYLYDANDYDQCSDAEAYFSNFFYSEFEVVTRMDWKENSYKKVDFFTHFTEGYLVYNVTNGLQYGGLCIEVISDDMDPSFDCSSSNSTIDDCNLYNLAECSSSVKLTQKLPSYAIYIYPDLNSLNPLITDLNMRSFNVSIEFYNLQTTSLPANEFQFFVDIYFIIGFIGGSIGILFCVLFMAFAVYFNVKKNDVARDEVVNSFFFTLFSEDQTNFTDGYEDFPFDPIDLSKEDGFALPFSDQKKKLLSNENSVNNNNNDDESEIIIVEINDSNEDDNNNNNGNRVDQINNIIFNEV